MNKTKVAQSNAIRVEVKRHENLKNSFAKLFKQLDRVQDEQLRSCLKVYLHSVKGRLTVVRYTILASGHI